MSGLPPKRGSTSDTKPLGVWIPRLSSSTRAIPRAWERSTARRGTQRRSPSAGRPLPVQPVDQSEAVHGEWRAAMHPWQRWEGKERQPGTIMAPQLVMVASIVAHICFFPSASGAQSKRGVVSRTATNLIRIYVLVALRLQRRRRRAGGRSIAGPRSTTSRPRTIVQPNDGSSATWSARSTSATPDCGGRRSWR